MDRWICRRRHRSAFTLIELLVVIAIVVLLVAILMPFRGARTHARSLACQPISAMGACWSTPMWRAMMGVLPTTRQHRYAHGATIASGRSRAGGTYSLTDSGTTGTSGCGPEWRSARPRCKPAQHPGLAWRARRPERSAGRERLESQREFPGQLRCERLGRLTTDRPARTRTGQ